MKENSFTGHALCQALRLEGVPQRAETEIESRLRRLWEHNGPDFVLDYIKVLKKDTESSLVNPGHKYQFNSGISVAWNHTEGRPKGPLGYIYRAFPKPIERIRVIGAILHSVTYEHATTKQISKFVANLRSRTQSSEVIRFPDDILRRLERSLEHHIKVMRPFGHTDLTNNVLPYGPCAQSTRQWKAVVHAASLDPSLRATRICHQAVLELDLHMRAQFYTAPAICKESWNQILRLVPDASSSLKFPSKVRPRPIAARFHETKTVDGNLLCSVSAEYDTRGSADFIGRLDFLQQTGGKLRSVANVNRYVNYTMVPYSKALEDVFYSMPECFVLDQKEGLRHTQRMLAKANSWGDSITSLDLSAATDTLDFRVFTNGLKRDFPGKTGLLEAYATYFERLSSLPLYCSALESPVQFRTGQPLGMKGSFQTLTAMNLWAGRLAKYRASAPCRCDYAVVGDDFVCTSPMAGEYNRIIKSWGGTTNVDKALSSPKYAEFLSHIVTVDNVYVTKPKYRPGSKALFVNAEKAKTRDLKGIFRLNEDEKEALRILSRYSVSEMDDRSNLPRLRSKDLSLDHSDLEVMSAALSVVSEYRSQKEKSFQISDQALEYLYEEDPLTVENNSFVPKAPDGAVGKGPGVHERIATVPSVVSRYDHKVGGHIPQVSRGQQYENTISQSKLIKTLDGSLKSPKDAVIDLGFGRKVRSDDIVLAGMELAEGHVRDRKRHSISPENEIRDLPPHLRDFLNSAIIDATKEREDEEFTP